jgi:dTDP-glucose 4,6-dehydratase
LSVSPTTQIINIDCRTYAANLEHSRYFSNFDRYREHEISIVEQEKIADVVLHTSPDVIVNFAAESHVDNSILRPLSFFQTNVLGTLSLLEATRALTEKTCIKPLFLQVSTDEVFGDLDPISPASREYDVYRPSSPYSASKASADHAVKSWARTYDMPTLITHCTNNYGPYQNSEKFIPVVIESLSRGKKIPLYGDGLQVRDWIFVDDHVWVLWNLLTAGIEDTVVNISAMDEIRNIDICRTIHSVLVDLGLVNEDFEQTFEFVADRKGHDRRYALNNEKLGNLLGAVDWTNIEVGIKSTIAHKLAV